MTKPAVARDPQNRAATRASRWFVILFVVYLIAGNVLLSFGAVNRLVVDPWTSLNTSWAARFASMLGFPAVSNGTVLTLDTTSLEVKQGCNGFHALLIFVCAIIACPTPWLGRLGGILAGSVVILGFNLVRLINLLLIARYYPQSLELFHVYIWQTLIVILAFGTFIGWGMLFARRNKTLAPAGQG